jgi:hemin uptake protein HemP
MADESSPKTGLDSEKQGAGPPAKQMLRPATPASQQPIRSEDLLRGSREVQILHAGELYRLTLTRAGKLILHK